MDGPVPHSKETGEATFPYARWMAQLPELRLRFSQASPYPHLVLDDFLQPEAARKALAAFPSADTGSWIHWNHVNERKLGKRNRAEIPPELQLVIDELNGPRFVAFLSELTGVEGLFADETLEGGGLHQSLPGGFLNIHADFTVHPHHQDWRRRVNVLLYLNPDWQDAYAGHLELWDREVTQCMQRIAPIFNRAVIFTTTSDAFHGHPEPLACPEGMSRKSLALYYFSQEARPVPVRATDYRARPQDRHKRLWIYLDKQMLALYGQIKRRLGLDDRLASALLEGLSRIRGGPR